MPRTGRTLVGGLCYYVINRGNGRAEVFHKPRDYQAFVAGKKKGHSEFWA
jgi:putative transposase